MSAVASRRQDDFKSSCWTLPTEPKMSSLAAPQNDHASRGSRSKTRAIERASVTSPLQSDGQLSTALVHFSQTMNDSGISAQTHTSPPASRPAPPLRLRLDKGRESTIRVNRTLPRVPLARASPVSTNFRLPCFAGMPLGRFSFDAQCSRTRWIEVFGGMGEQSPRTTHAPRRAQPAQSPPF